MIKEIKEKWAITALILLVLVSGAYAATRAISVDETTRKTAQEAHFTNSNNTYAIQVTLPIIIQAPTNGQIYWSPVPFATNMVLKEAWVKTEGTTCYVDIATQPRGADWTDFSDTMLTGLFGTQTASSASSFTFDEVTNEYLFGIKLYGMEQFDFTNKVLFYGTFVHEAD